MNKNIILVICIEMFKKQNPGVNFKLGFHPTVLLNFVDSC
jgi:hypothetical protein